MSEFQVIERAISSGKHFLTVIDHQVFLCAEGERFATEGSLRPTVAVVLDLKSSYEEFRRRAVGTQYRSTEIATAAGISGNSLAKWDAHGILSPSLKQRSGRGVEKIYSREDCFCAGLCGALRRQGVSLAAVAKVVRFLKGVDTQAQEQLEGGV